jgi:hypothetical protein
MNTMKKKWDSYAGSAYLALVCATDYPEQEPAHLKARWFDLLWLLIPIAGIAFFLGVIESRAEQ